MARSAWTANHAVAAPTPAPADFRWSQGGYDLPGRGGSVRAGTGDESSPTKLPLRGIFDIKSKHYDVVLETDRISWSLIQPTRHNGSRRRSIHNSVSMKDVYGVAVKRVEKPGKDQGYPKGVSIYVATPSHKDPNVLTEERITLRSTNEEYCQKWRGAIEAVLKGMSDRPRKLRVLVNDWVNDGEAARIFYTKVVPVFQLAGTRLDVIVTTREGSAYQILQTLDFEGYDGVVCVGGEDTTREVVHGLLERTQLDADLIEITPDTKLTKCPIPLGIIPVGLFNLVAHSSQGTSDPFTSAVHIVQGHRQALDVSAIFHNEAFIRFGFSIMYGFGGECLRRAERRAKKGVIGQRGAEYAFAKTVFKVRTYRCVVEYLPCDRTTTERLPCRTGCERCRAEQPANDDEDTGELARTSCRNGERGGGGHDVRDADHQRNGAPGERCKEIETQTQQTKDDSSLSEEWTRLTDSFVSVAAMTLPNLCSWCPLGLSPLTHLGDGSLDLMLVRGTTRGEFVQHLRRFAGAKDQFDFPFVSVHRARGVRIHPIDADNKPCASLVNESPSEGDTTCSEEASLQTDNGGAVTVKSGKEFSMWNVDMELMAPVAVEMRVHRQLLTVFASGIHEATGQNLPSCGCL